MSTSKSLTTGIATAALVATIGLAYAQSSTDSTPQQPATTDSSTMQQPDTTAAPADSSMGQSAAPAADAGNTPPADGPTSSSMTATEPEPRADRN